MINNRYYLILVASVLLFLFAGCDYNRQKSVYPEFPDKPSRQAYEGFQREEVAGAGLRFWAQQGEGIRVVTDCTLPGALIEWDGLKQSRRMVIQVFTLKDKRIEDVLELLRKTPDWDETQTGSFKEQKSHRKGVKRYILTPAGEYQEAINKASSSEPIPATCNGWGVGNSGIRYFEIHENCPDKALFIEIGQEAPLFDEQSIVITEEINASNNENDSLMTVKGRLVIGHEVRSFVAENDTTEYWIIDKSAELMEEYDLLTGGVKNGTPINVELKVRFAGESDDGFAAEYAGVYHAMNVVSASLE